MVEGYTRRLRFVLNGASGGSCGHPAKEIIQEVQRLIIQVVISVSSAATIGALLRHGTR